ncbi:MAG TPA: PQQ-binding-like beta-propeller repeat protein, partial [Mycobacteriales bacterium]|nr:PQQ-binding-like beta-propeller repeat protein [Mycobacteriales bacterium]
MGKVSARFAHAAIAALIALPLVSVADASAAAPAAQPAAVTPGPSDWPTDRYNDDRINTNLAETELSPANVGQLHLAWSTTTGDITHNPIVIGNTVFAACAYALCSYDRMTGVLNWDSTIPGLKGVLSDPTYGDGLVFIGGSESLTAFDPSTGDVVWQDSFTSDADQPYSWVQFSPVYDNGMVFVSTNSNTVHAVDAATGVQIWSNPNGGSSELAADNGLLYAGSIFYEKTGAVMTGGNAEGFWPGPVVITDDRVISGLNEYPSYGNDDPDLPPNSPLLWRYPEPQWSPQMQPAAANNTLYYAASDNSGFHSPDVPQEAPELNALTLKTQWNGTFTHDWQTLLPASADGDGAPTVADGVVYTLTTTGELYAANATTGALLWHYATGSDFPEDPYFTAPVVADGMLFVVTGEQLFAFTTDPGISSGVPAQPTQLITAAGDGQVTLAWTEPSTAGAVTSYQIAISPSGRVVTVGGTATTITGLRDWTAYTFTITARNAAGGSPPLASPPIQLRPQITIATVRPNGNVVLYGAGGWSSIGGQATSAPAVVSVDGEPYVFVRGPDDRIWVRSPHTAWQLFGPRGACASGPAASMSKDGTLVEVACRASDNHLLTATSAEPDSAAVPHASAWTYSAITLR